MNRPNALYLYSSGLFFKFFLFISLFQEILLRPLGFRLSNQVQQFRLFFLQTKTNKKSRLLFLCLFFHNNGLKVFISSEVSFSRSLSLFLQKNDPVLKNPSMSFSMMRTNVCFLRSLQKYKCLLREAFQQHFWTQSKIFQTWTFTS